MRSRSLEKEYVIFNQPKTVEMTSPTGLSKLPPSNSGRKSATPNVSDKAALNMTNVK